MPWSKSSRTSSKKRQQILAVVLTFTLLVIVFLIWFFTLRTREDVINNPIITFTEEESAAIQDTPLVEPEFDAATLQGIVDDWVKASAGSVSVVVSDSNNTVLASSEMDKVFDAASIYKLYVAYAGYQQIDSGLVDPAESYISGYTRKECLDRMIRVSDNPCAEKLWNEINQSELTNQLQTYGITNTSMTMTTTTAYDATIMLGRILRGEGLSTESHAAYISSLRDQEPYYRRGLPSGFSKATVYNKVGFKDLVEWHDTAIVELPDTRTLLISVFTENVGFSTVAQLGSAIEASLN